MTEIKFNLPSRYGFLLVLLLAACSGPEAEQSKAKSAEGMKKSVSIATFTNGSVGKDDMQAYLLARPVEGQQDIKKAVDSRLDELITTEVLYQEAVKKGIDQEFEVRQTIRQILAQRLLEDQVLKPLQGKKYQDSDLRKYYDEHLSEYARPAQVRLADIFIAVPDDNPAARSERRQQAEKVLAEALARREERFAFSELMETHSEKHLAYAKGDTGFIDQDGATTKGIEAELVEAGFGLQQPGEILDHVVETEKGLHIIMLASKKDATKREFDDVKAEIEQRLMREDVSKKRQEYLSSLKSGAGIRIDEDLVSSLAREEDEKIKNEQQQDRKEGTARRGNAGPPQLPGAK